MTYSNHILAGSIVALTFKQPTLVLPLAFLSHFVLDALPHYGYPGGGFQQAFSHKLTYLMEGINLIFLVVLFASINFSVLVTALAAAIAVSPDFEWAYRYFFFERKGLKPKDYWFTKFHKSIQWCERPWGIIAEVAFFAAGFILLQSYVL